MYEGSIVCRYCLWVRNMKVDYTSHDFKLFTLLKNNLYRGKCAVYMYKLWGSQQNESLGT